MFHTACFDYSVLSLCTFYEFTAWQPQKEPGHKCRSYPGKRENILPGQMILFCSYGEMLPHLLGKVSPRDIEL